jgi:hypothetical protein
MSSETKWVFKVRREYNGTAVANVPASEVDTLKKELDLGDEFSEGTWVGQAQNGRKCYDINVAGSQGTVIVSRALFSRVEASKKCVLSMAA